MSNTILVPYIALGICILFLALCFYDMKRSYVITVSVFFTAVAAAFKNPFCLHMGYGYNLNYLIGIYIVFIIIMFTRFGAGDCRFTMSKCLCWYLLGFCLIFIGSIFNPILSLAQFCMLIGLMIFIGCYPFSGWLDHFLIHTPKLLFFIYSLFFRPILCGMLTLWLLASSEYTIRDQIYNLVKICGGVSVLFIPLLFFIKKDLRRLLAYMVIVQSGFYLLFISNPNIVAVNAMILSFVQGTILFNIFNVIIFIQKAYQTDNLVACRGMMFANKNIARLLISLFSLLQLVNLYVSIKIYYSLWILVISLISIAISCVFIQRIYCSFSKEQPDDNNLIKFNLIDKIRIILLVCSTFLILAI